MKKLLLFATAVIASTTANAQIPTTGLVARYDFSNYGDGSGNNLGICDGTGGSQPIPPLQLSNNSFHPAGDSAAYFNGLSFFDTYCTSVNGEFVSPSASISAWFKLDQLPQNYNTIACVRYDNNGGSNPYNTINLYTSNNNPVGGKLAMSFSTDGVIPNPTPHDVFDITVVGTTVLQAGVWYHATCSYDATTGTAKLYLNGVEESSAIVNGDLLFNGSSALTIGHVEGGVGYNGFVGLIDEVLYYNRPLTSTEVCQIAGDACATPPAAPSNVLLSVPNPTYPNAVRIEWTDNSNNEVQFQVFRSTDNANFSNINGSGGIPANTSATYDYVSSNGMYYYYVCANNNAGQSCSAVQQISITGMTTQPNAPTNLTATTPFPETSDLILLTWTDNADNEDGFNIYRGTDFSNLSLVDDNSANDTNWNDNQSGFLSSGTYYYKVCAYINAEESCSGITQVTIGEISGIAESSANTLRIYPNPAQNVLYIETGNTTELSIFNTFGAIVKTQTLNRGTNPLNVNSLAGGIYFVRTAKGATTKFVKE